MKLYPFLILFALSFVLTQCTSSGTEDSKPSQESLKEKISEIDDSLNAEYQKIMKDGSVKIPSLLIYESINRHLAFVQAYPNDAYSATCLDKVHQLYMQEKAYDKSVQYADTLLLNFPNYKFKKDV